MIDGVQYAPALDVNQVMMSIASRQFSSITPKEHPHTVDLYLLFSKNDLGVTCEEFQWRRFLSLFFLSLLVYFLNRRDITNKLQ